jgi:hypothetical protein
MDEVAPAPVDERAVGMPSSTQRKMCLEAGSASQDLRLEAGIVVHRNTSVYININQVDGRSIYYDREDLERWTTSSKRNSTSDPGTNQPP